MQSSQWMTIIANELFSFKAISKLLSRPNFITKSPPLSQSLLNSFALLPQREILQRYSVKWKNIYHDLSEIQIKVKPKLWLCSDFMCILQLSCILDKYINQKICTNLFFEIPNSLMFFLGLHFTLLLIPVDKIVCHPLFWYCTFK